MGSTSKRTPDVGAAKLGARGTPSLACAGPGAEGATDAPGDLCTRARGGAPGEENRASHASPPSDDSLERSHQSPTVAVRAPFSITTTTWPLLNLALNFGRPTRSATLPTLWEPRATTS